MTKLCDRTSAVEKKLSPHDVFTKLTPDDEIDAYLELFEWTALRQHLPREEWGAILAPFLMGKHRRPAGICRLWMPAATKTLKLPSCLSTGLVSLPKPSGSPVDLQPYPSRLCTDDDPGPTNPQLAGRGQWSLSNGPDHPGQVRTGATLQCQKICGPTMSTGLGHPGRPPGEPPSNPGNAAHHPN